MKRFFAGALLAALPLLGAGSVCADQIIPSGNHIITQWGWDTTATPIVGTGTYTSSIFGNGVGTSSPFAGAGGGSPNDTFTTAANNLYLVVNGSRVPGDTAGLTPATGDPSGQGVGFKCATNGQSNITLSWDQQIGYRASRYYQLKVTTDGVNWNNVSGGTGTGPVTLGAGTSTATVDNNGLITIVCSTPNGNLGGGMTGMTASQSTANFNLGLSYTLPAGAWENNPNFGIAILAIYNPFQSNPSASDYGYVASTSGLNYTDTSVGYIRAAASGGGQRFDLVTVSGVPEPTSLALLAATGLLCRRSRK